jgi:hypothetical protein
MTYVNGVTSHEPSPPTALAPDDSENNQVISMSPERRKHIREQLSEPFDPGEIK